MKQNLLIVGDYNRNDTLQIGKYLNENFNIFFIEYLDSSEIKSFTYKNYGTAIFWKDYKNAYQLLDLIKPIKVLFYFIESYNHVAINVACKHFSIPTFHLEHGIRNREITKFVSLNLKTTLIRHNKWVTLFNSLKNLKSIINRINNRKFYFRTVQQSNKAIADFLREYYDVRSKNNIFDTFEKVNNPLRIADQYISFSPKVFEFHRISDHLPMNYPVKYIGNPVFDEYAILKEKKLNGRAILLIDQPFHEQNLLGWSAEDKFNFYKSLIEVGKVFNRKLFIKPHPLNDQTLYNSLTQDDMVELVASEVFKSIIPECEIILGFASTLLLPLICLPYTVCFCYENHPSPLPIEYSKFLSDSNAITKVCSIEELKDRFEQIEDLKNHQKNNKKKFEEDWLFKFDGKSLERLKKIILDEAY